MFPIQFVIFPFPRLLIYGKYCSHMEYAQTTLNHLIANREDVRQKVEVSASGCRGLPGPCHGFGRAAGAAGTLEMLDFVRDGGWGLSLCYPSWEQSWEVSYPGPCLPLPLPTQNHALSFLPGVKPDDSIWAALFVHRTGCGPIAVLVETQRH